MNTHVHNWLRRAALMLVVLASALPVLSQDEIIEGGEAFYIYQNDGHFDGFFYDQVKQISYSRFDTLGIEHNEYVSQEIVTADSTYRIMLTAIDSVSFFQPEIKFAKGLRFMRDEGMLDYYLSMETTDEGYVLRFSATMPETLRPRVDDVLSCPDLTDYDEAFVGKVKSVSEAGGEIVVKCGFVEDYKDVFEQFITVEQVRNVQTPEGAQMRRRIAGWKQPKKIEGNIEEFTLFNLSTGTEFSTKFGQLTFGMGFNVCFAMSVSSVYNISLSKFYFKHELKEQLGFGASISLDGELYSNPDLMEIPVVKNLFARFTKIPIPINFPILDIELTPSLFGKFEAHMKVALNAGAKVTGLAQRIETKPDFPWIDIQQWPTPPPFPALIPIKLEPSAEWGISAQLNGSFQAGVKFPLALSTETWFSKLLGLRTGIDIYVGPKVTGELNLDLFSNTDDGFFTAERKKTAYDVLKSSKVDIALLSVDPEISTNVNVGKRKWEMKRTTNLSLGAFTLHLFPNFKEFKCEISGDKLNIVTATCNIDGETCMPELIGFALYKNKDENDSLFTELYRDMVRPESYFINTFNSFKLTMEHVAPGIYKAYPIVKLPIGVTVPVTPCEQTLTIASQELELNPTYVTAEEEGGTFEVDLLGSFDVPITAMPNDDWIEVEVKEGQGFSKIPYMKVTVKPNDTDKYRTGTITATQQLKDGGIVERELIVNQYGGLQIEPDKVTFGPEEGDTFVDVLTSMKPVTFNIKDGGEEWLMGVWYEEDRQYHLTAQKNNGPQRKCTITVAAWSEKYQGISTVDLTVVQKGLVDVVLDKEELAYEANGGTQTVSVTMGSDGAPAKYEFKGITVDDEDKEWIIVEKLPSSFNVTALPNTTAEERVSIIYANFTKKNSSDSGPETYQIAVKITQKASTASVTDEELYFQAKGGKLTTKINFGIFPYCGAYFNDDVKWAKFSVGDDGTVTVTVQENTSALERECTLVCYVSGKLNPEDKEMVKMPVRIVQEGMTITPDGEESPFNYINFWATHTVHYVSEEAEVDTIVSTNLAFNFKAEYSHFTMEEEKGIIHITCEGFLDDPGSLQSTKATGVLSFDIDKANRMVRNLNFKVNSENLLIMHPMPFVDTETVMNNVTELTTSDFPLQSYFNTYKEGKYSVAEGLRFTSYSSMGDSKTTYTFSPPLDPKDAPSPFIEHSAYTSVGDSEDYVWLIISMKETAPALEWPDDEVMQSLENGGMPIHEGGTPPTVSGTYSLSPINVVSDKMGTSEEMGDINGMVLKFSGQSSGKLDVDFYFTAYGEADSAYGVEKALIKGSGNSFSICVPMPDNSLIVSGTVSDDGTISDLYVAWTETYVPDKYLIMKDDDGYSAPTTWAPAPDEDE